MSQLNVGLPEFRDKKSQISQGHFLNSTCRFFAKSVIRYKLQNFFVTVHNGKQLPFSLKLVMKIKFQAM